MLNEDQLRLALDGRTLTTVSRETGISYDALYRFVGKSLSLFDHATLSDYIECKTQAVQDAAHDATDAPNTAEGAK